MCNCKIVLRINVLFFFLFIFYDKKSLKLLNHPSFCPFTSQTSSSHPESLKNPNLKPPPSELPMKHRSVNEDTQTDIQKYLIDSTTKDSIRIQTQITQKHHHQEHEEQVIPKPYSDSKRNQLMATVNSGVSLGSGEYFIDVMIGTPPKHFSLILDTGSDLNWIQCVPCYECFEQKGTHFNPLESKSYNNISCQNPNCNLVSAPEPSIPCNSITQSCSYFYWYGDKSNTTGDFALETFTLNLTNQKGESEFKQIENVMFGCGHWNRGQFHGASGILGLGRGPLSFSSQLQSIYNHSFFSYCLVDRNNDLNVKSKLIFGEDPSSLSDQGMKFTKLLSPQKNISDSFYYVQVKGIRVGNEVLEIPNETWEVSEEGEGGTILDSGTTLTYFADSAYKIIKNSFIKKIKNYPLVKDFPHLNPCYNVSGLNQIEFPEFSIIFEDDVVWDFPLENYFIRLDPEGIVCLAILGTPSMSILGNYLQQNFHILYDMNKSRVGFSPKNCSNT